MAILADKLYLAFTPVLGSFTIQSKSGTAALQAKIHEDLGWVTIDQCYPDTIKTINNALLGTQYRFMPIFGNTDVDSPTAVMTHTLLGVECGDCIHAPAVDMTPAPVVPEPPAPPAPPEPQWPGTVPIPEPWPDADGKITPPQWPGNFDLLPPANWTPTSPAEPPAPLNWTFEYVRTPEGPTFELTGENALPESEYTFTLELYKPDPVTQRAGEHHSNESVSITTTNKGTYSGTLALGSLPLPGDYFVRVSAANGQASATLRFKVIGPDTVWTATYTGAVNTPKFRLATSNALAQTEYDVTVNVYESDGTLLTSDVITITSDGSGAFDSELAPLNLPEVYGQYFIEVTDPNGVTTAREAFMMADPVIWIFGLTNTGQSTGITLRSQNARPNTAYYFNVTVYQVDPATQEKGDVYETERRVHTSTISGEVATTVGLGSVLPEGEYLFQVVAENGQESQLYPVEILPPPLVWNFTTTPTETTPKVEVTTTTAAPSTTYSFEMVVYNHDTVANGAGTVLQRRTIEVTSNASREASGIFVVEPEVLLAGTYHVQVTAANGSKSEMTKFVIHNPNIEAMSINAAAPGENIRLRVTANDFPAGVTTMLAKLYVDEVPAVVEGSPVEVEFDVSIVTAGVSVSVEPEVPFDTSLPQGDVSIVVSSVTGASFSAVKVIPMLTLPPEYSDLITLEIASDADGPKIRVQRSGMSPSSQLSTFVDIYFNDSDSENTLGGLAASFEHTFDANEDGVIDAVVALTPPSEDFQSYFVTVRDEFGKLARPVTVGM